MGAPAHFPSPPAMRRCPDVAVNWTHPVPDASGSDASLRTGRIQFPDASRQRRIAGRGDNWTHPVPDVRRCPDASGTGCVQLSPFPAMRRCPDASGNWMRPVNGDASLPGCVRNWGLLTRTPWSGESALGSSSWGFAIWLSRPRARRRIIVAVSPGHTWRPWCDRGQQTPSATMSGGLLCGCSW
jgi:hypothetical protein